MADDESISEIMVNGIDSIFIERNGIIEETSLAFDDVTQLEELIRRLSAKMHKEIKIGRAHV